VSLRQVEDFVRPFDLRTWIWGCGVISSALFLKYAEVPFLWIGALWGCLLLWDARYCASQFQRAICVNLGVVSLTLAMMEAVLHQPTSSLQQSYSEGAHQIHEILGYGPPRNATIEETVRYQDKVLYTVSYRINDKGLRNSYPHLANEPLRDECVLFFGDSFTYGEGVEDAETMPAVVGALAAERYTVYNFGYHGYGPHQMLATLETGLVDSTVMCSPKIAVYQAIPYHVSRSAGLESWDRHGPRYTVTSDGDVAWTGHFDDYPISEEPAGLRNRIGKIEMALPQKLRWQLAKSSI